MSKKNSMGQTKRSTDDLINDAISQQNDWLENRREYTRGFLKSLNLFARPSDKKSDTQNLTRIQLFHQLMMFIATKSKMMFSSKLMMIVK